MSDSKLAKRGLGRGLSALMADLDLDGPAEAKPVKDRTMVPIEQITANPAAAPGILGRHLFPMCQEEEGRRGHEGVIRRWERHRALPDQPCTGVQARMQAALAATR